MLKAAIESTLSQDFQSFEHIVVDGGSDSETVELLSHHPHIHVIRETDRNLYEAINKGIRAARGQVIGFLNSDDAYASGAFHAAAKAFIDPKIDVLLGGAEFVASDSGALLRILHGWQCVGLTEDNVIGDVTVMNAGFYRRALIEKVGLFDERFPISSDKDFWLRLTLQAPNCVVIPETTYRYQTHSGSLTFSAAEDMRFKLSMHLLHLASVRFAECQPGTATYKSYRKWHAWAAGYCALQQLRRSEFFGALETSLKALSADALWPLSFAARLPRHWSGRDARRGAKKFHAASRGNTRQR